MSQSTSPNMPREDDSETLNTLKKIQAIGLSVSVVKKPGPIVSPFAAPTTVAQESKPKQNALAVDKGFKTVRSTVSTEVKTQPTLVRASSAAETRVSSVHTPVSSFHENKTPVLQNRLNPPVSEPKIFNSSWASSNTPTDSKPQSNMNRPMISTPVNKLVSGQIRPNQLLIPENKTPVSKSNQVAFAENKIQGRITQGPRLVPVSAESKIQVNQERVIINSASPHDVVNFSSPLRTNQPFVTTLEGKTPSGPRIIAPKPVDIKMNQMTPGSKQTEAKTPSNRGLSNVRLVSDSKTRPSFITRVSGKLPGVVSGENKLVNPVRMVTAIADGNVVRIPSGKMSMPVRTHAVQNFSEFSPAPAKSVQGSSAQFERKLHPSGVKVVVSSSDVSQKPSPGFDKSPESSMGNSLIARNPGGKRAASAKSPAKKKCVKRQPQIVKNSSMMEHEDLNSSEEGNEHGEKYFNTLALKSRGLNITPVPQPSAASTTTASISSGNPRMAGDNLDKEVYRVMCPSCNNVTSNPKFCHICQLNLNPNTSIQNTQQSSEVVQGIPGASYVVKKTTNIVKQIIIQSPDGFSPGQSLQFGQTVQRHVLFKSKSQHIQTSPRTARTQRRRKNAEPPVILTLSSDEEEDHMEASYNTMNEENMSQTQGFPQESEGSKSGQSSPAYPEDENNESDDQFPGVTEINEKLLEENIEYEEEDEEQYRNISRMEVEEGHESIGEEEEEEEEEEEPEEEEVEEEEEEEEEIPQEEEEEEGEFLLNKSFTENASGIEDPLRCRSVRIGSLKVHPKPNSSSLHVVLSSDGLAFTAPKVTDQNKIVSIILKPTDITQMLVHFGRCLPIVFVFTTPNFAEALRKSLNMTIGDFAYFDPNSNDEKQKKITFLVDSINEEQRKFLRNLFLDEKKVQELDQKTANEILVRSTPNQAQYQRCDLAQGIQVPLDNQLTVTPVMQPSVSVKLVTVPVPVKKLFTYPPPPQTGGIAITNEDLACLDEGEFLNDAIIDFYLKYVFYEKLDEYNRDKTHIFSSYFFPRLTSKPERSRPGDEALKTLQARRHSQVKTWTRHVDIFSKDFIIIPVNQNVHWFLAIICYPGLVPEASEASLNLPKPDSKMNNKSSDNVTSTDDQEDSKSTSKDLNSTIDGSNPNSDENSTASSGSAFENEEQELEESPPEAPDSSTHPDKNTRKKEAPCICIFDSLNGPNRSKIATMLREYLEMEWKMKKGTRKIFDKNTMQGFIMQVPQQTNYSDCGIYLLQYVESFFENPIPFFDNPIPSLANWFSKEKVAKKRQELKDLIISLQKKHENVRKTNTTESTPPPSAQTLQTDNR